MSWVYVEKDGTELIDRYKPFRFAKCVIGYNDIQNKSGLLKEDDFSFYCRRGCVVCGEVGVQEVWNWGDDWVMGTFELKDEHIVGWSNKGVPLPNGTIEKIIGRTLTWSDEPVELK